MVCSPSRAASRPPFSTSCQSTVGDLFTVSHRHPCPGFHKGWEPLGEDFALTAGIATVEFRHREAELDSASCTGSITQDSAGVAMEG